jgi:hypothetical protein
MKTRLGVGIEIGNTADGTAIAIVERCNPKDYRGNSDCPADQAEYHVRHLERFPGGTKYADIRDQIAKIIQLPELKPDTALVQIAADQTVVAPTIVDLILASAKGRSIKRLLLTNQHTVSEADGLISVPKQHITGNIQAMLETGRLKIAESLKVTPELANELRNYRERKTIPSPSAEAWRTSPADDLVFAVGIACWRLQQPRPVLEVELLLC